jgi:hypothetical protein
MVHAGDDRSMTESLQSLPAIAKTVGTIASIRPYSVGPSAIGMRANPYGDQPKSNPRNIRQAMNWNDPRQRGQLGAAWNLGYFARFAYGGASAIALGGLTGPFGVLHSPAQYPQPWYDDQGGMFPVFHILRGLAALRGMALRRIDISRPDSVLGLAAESTTATEVWLANLTEKEEIVHLDTGDFEIAYLNANNFIQASHMPDLLDRFSASPRGQEIRLSSYAVARIRIH